MLCGKCAQTYIKILFTDAFSLFSHFMDRPCGFWNVIYFSSLKPVVFNKKPRGVCLAFSAPVCK